MLTDMGASYPAFLTPFGVGILALTRLWCDQKLSRGTVEVWKPVVRLLKNPQQLVLSDIFKTLNEHDHDLLKKELQLVETADALYTFCFTVKSKLGAKSLLGRYIQEWCVCVEMTDFDLLVDFLERFWKERDTGLEKHPPALVSAIENNDVVRGPTLLHEHYDHQSRTDSSIAYPPPRALVELAGMHDKWGHPKAAMFYLEQAMKQARTVGEYPTTLKAAISAYMLKEPLSKNLGDKKRLLSFLNDSETPDIAEELSEIRASEGDPQWIEAHMKMLPIITDKGHFHMTQAESWFRRGKGVLSIAHLRLAAPFAENCQLVQLRLKYFQGICFRDLDVTADEDLGLLLDAQRLAAQGSYDVARHVLGLIKDPAAQEDVLRLEFEMLFDEGYSTVALDKACELEKLSDNTGTEYFKLQCQLRKAQALSALENLFDLMESRRIAQEVHDKANQRGWTPLSIQAQLLLTKDYAPLIPQAAACSRRLEAEVSVIYALHGGPMEPAVAIAAEWPDLIRRLQNSEPSSPAGWKRQLETPEMPKKRRGYNLY